jgi:hypothetical protein
VIYCFQHGFLWPFRCGFAHFAVQTFLLKSRSPIAEHPSRNCKHIPW